MKTGRLHELDVLRGLAALGVLVFHFTDHLDISNVHPAPLGFRFTWGMQGVQLFFMISGFVIFMTLEKTQRSMDFVVSRFSRLFPAYWVAIVATFVTVSVLGLPHEERTLRDVVVNFTMFQEYFRVPHVDSAYWTLQVEILFYIIMLALYAAGYTRHIVAVLWAWLGLRFVYLAAAAFLGVDFSWTLGKTLILSYIPYFAMGIAFYRAMEDRRTLRSGVPLIAASLALVWWAEGRVPGTIAVFFVAVFALFVFGRLQFIVVPPLVFLGAISYPLYLLHENIGKAVMRQLYRFGLGVGFVNVLLASAVCIALAAALSAWVERPAMHWIRAWWKTRRVEALSGEPAITRS